jgi:hypothetical protein
MQKLVCESLNEFVSKDEEAWADTQIDRWEMKKKGIDPTKKYVEEVSKLILKNLDDDIIEYYKIEKGKIQKFIGDFDILETNVFDYYNQNKPTEVAAYELKLSLENYFREEWGG